METFSTIENFLLLVKHFIKEDVTTSYILCYDPTFSCINYDKVKEPLPHLTIVMKGRPKNSSRGTKLLCNPTSKSCSLFETP